MNKRYGSHSSTQRHKPLDDWDDNYQYSYHDKPSRLKKVMKWLCGITVALVLLTIISYIMLYFGTQNDTSVGGNSKGIQICIIQPQAYTSHVFISFSDKEGNWSQPEDLPISGDQLTVQGEMITSQLPNSANGFKTISINGSYSNPSFKSNSTPTPSLLNKEDWLFALSQQPIISLLIHGSRQSIFIHLNPNIKPNTVTLYTLIPTDNGLVLRQEPHKLSSCNNPPR